LSGGWDTLGAYTISYDSEVEGIEYYAKVTGDVTGVIGPRMKIKLTQDAEVKYFVCTAAELVEGNTILTLFGGLDYTLTDSAISDTYVSMYAAPVGFPQDRARWRVEVYSNVDAKIESGVRGRVYNIGDQSVVVPTGSWKIMALYAIDFNGKAQVDYDMWLDSEITGNGEGYCWTDTGIWNLCNYRKFYHSCYAFGFITAIEPTTLYVCCKSTYDAFLWYTLDELWIVLELDYL
jgi:hypothetical protein